MSERRPNRDECLSAAGEAFAEALARRDALTPHAAALAAHVPGGPTVAELEQRIREDRAARTAAPTDTPRPTG